MIKKTKKKLLKRNISLLRGGSGNPSTKKKFMNFFKRTPKLTEEEKEKEKIEKEKEKEKEKIEKEKEKEKEKIEKEKEKEKEQKPKKKKKK